MIIEACVESLEEALYAEKHGAQQIELCSRLDLDGLTPARNLVEEVLKKTDLKVKVMIRPRAGNFVYTFEEKEQMAQQIRWCKSAGIAEIVFGLLTAENEIDMDGTRRLAAVEPSLSITFHKAIDQVNDPLLAVKQLCEISNIDYILSSGQEATAWAGRVLLKKMKKAAEEKLQIIVAGKVTPANINELQAAIGASYYHGRNIV